jgi:hypothetical protein
LGELLHLAVDQGGDIKGGIDKDIRPDLGKGLAQPVLDHAAELDHREDLTNPNFSALSSMAALTFAVNGALAFSNPSKTAPTTGS